MGSKVRKNQRNRNFPVLGILRSNSQFERQPHVSRTIAYSDLCHRRDWLASTQNDKGEVCIEAFSFG